MDITKRRSSFPDRLALVNPINDRAYEMRFVREERISNGAGEKVELNHISDYAKCDISNGQNADLLKFTTKSNVQDAVLLVRPFVRMVDGDGSLSGRLIFKVDGVIVVNDPVEQYLVESMDSKTLDVPMNRPQTKIMFYAACMTEQGVDCSKVYGVIGSSGTVLELSIRGPVWSKGGTVRIEAGCIAAQYTTRRDDGLRR